MPVMLQTTLLLICSNVFRTFAWYAHFKDMKQPLKLNYLWAALCICGAVYFVFRDA
jgi:uncharacterized protein (DUF486 family)